MQLGNGRTTACQALVRSLLSPVLRTGYGLLGQSVRGRIGAIASVGAVYRQYLKPLLFSPRVDQGLVLTRFSDFAIYVDIKDMPGALSLGRPWEPTTTAVFRKVVGLGDVVIDVGAHWGYYSVLAATLCGEAGKVFAFEPHPVSYALLARNIAANGLRNIVAVQKAVSDRSATAELFLSSNSLGHSLVHEPLEWQPPAATFQQSIMVETVTLDEFFSTSGVRPRLLKMDIEGAEPLALRGMERLIGRNPQMAIILELNPHYLDAYAAKDLLKKLAFSGLEFLVIDEATEQALPASCEGTIRQFLSLQRGRVLNLFCTRDQGLIAGLAKTCN